MMMVKASAAVMVLHDGSRTSSMGVLVDMPALPVVGGLSYGVGQLIPPRPLKSIVQ